MEELTQQDQEFVKEVAITGNQTKAAKKAYKYKSDNVAGVMGNRKLRNVKVAKALEETKRTLAERIPDDLLEKVHLEGLEADKKVFKNNNATGEIEEVSSEPDFAVRHKYLDSAYKLKGIYAPEKSVNVNIDIDTASPEARQLAEEYEQKLKAKI